VREFADLAEQHAPEIVAEAVAHFLHRILVADRSTQLHQIFRADDAHAAPFACATMTMPTRETARPKAIAQDNGSSNMIQAQIVVTGGLR
jgi:hypothetical protein